MSETANKIAEEVKPKKKFSEIEEVYGKGNKRAAEVQYSKLFL